MQAHDTIAPLVESAAGVLDAAARWVDSVAAGRMAEAALTQAEAVAVADGSYGDGTARLVLLAVVFVIVTITAAITLAECR